MTQFGQGFGAGWENMVWPKVKTLQSARRAAMQGVWVTIALIAVYWTFTLLVLFDPKALVVRKDVFFGALIGLPIQVIIAWRIAKMSIMAAVLGLAWYLFGLIAMQAWLERMSLGPFAVFIIGAYINSIRGTCAFHRLSGIEEVKGEHTSIKKRFGPSKDKSLPESEMEKIARLQAPENLDPKSEYGRAGTVSGGIDEIGRTMGGDALENFVVILDKEDRIGFVTVDSFRLSEAKASFPLKSYKTLGPLKLSAGKRDGCSYMVVDIAGRDIWDSLKKQL